MAALPVPRQIRNAIARPGTRRVAGSRRRAVAPANVVRPQKVHEKPTTNLDVVKTAKPEFVNPTTVYSCQHRGVVLRVVETPLCNSRSRHTEVFACSEFGECTVTKARAGRQTWKACNNCEARLPDGQTTPQRRRSRRRRVGFFNFYGDHPQFITYAQLMADAHTLATKLPHDTSRIIGISRSGVCVSTMVAMLLHLRHDIWRQSKGDLIEGGNGWRLSGNTGGSGPAVLIDDTCMTGNSFKAVLPLLRKEVPNIISAAVYVNPSARHKPEVWVHDLPWPHVLQWNICNSVLAPHCALDFDGIICRDCTREEDDDGPRYLNFLRTASLLYAFRKVPIPLIVTARLEKYRAETERWLVKHGMRAIRLEMGPWSTNAERARADIAAFKAGHFRSFMKQRHAIKPPLFMESDERQAKRIAELSGGYVVCPAAGRVFP